MKKFCIFLTLFSYFFSIKSFNTSLLYNLQTLQTDYISQQNNSYGSTIKSAFRIFHATSKNSKTSSLLKNNNIAQLFQLLPSRSDDDTFNNYLVSTQNIMLIYLHAKMFNDYIAESEELIEQVLCALEYWKTENFYHKLSMIRKHPTYWLHSPEHKKLVYNKIKILEKMKEETALLLGIALHGRYQLGTIQDSSEMFTKLTQAKNPLVQKFCMIEQDYTGAENSSLQDAIWLHENMMQQLKNCKKIALEHKKPHHCIEHGFFYGCLAATIIASYAIYKINEDQFPEYKEKSMKAWSYFLKEYINEPFKGLKETLWDNKSKQLQELEDWPIINDLEIGKLAPWPEVDNFTTRWSDTQKDLNKIIASSNQNKETLRIFSNNLTLGLNQMIKSSNQNKKTIVKFINDLSKDQQLTLSLAAISPVVIGTYASYRFVNHTYNKYIKHESWYQPMKLILRDIDQILNKLTSQDEISYADDGMLHALTLQLRTYISCLPNEELQLIQEDLRELSDYKISYEQKRGVLLRMYKTYEFLN